LGQRLAKALRKDSDKIAPLQISRQEVGDKVEPS
jgi:hypothetical protein